MPLPRARREPGVWAEAPQPQGGEAAAGRTDGRTDGRASPGLCSSAGVDDAESECGLDRGVTFDWVLSNDGDERALDEQLQPLLRALRGRL